MPTTPTTDVKAKAEGATARRGSGTVAPSLQGLFAAPTTTSETPGASTSGSASSGRHMPTSSFVVSGDYSSNNNDADNNDNDDSNAGSQFHLQTLFSQNSSGALSSTSDNNNNKSGNDDQPSSEHPLQRKRTQKGSNTSKSRQNNNETTGLIEAHNREGMMNSNTSSYVSSSFRRLSQNSNTGNNSNNNNLFESPFGEKTPRAGPAGHKQFPVPPISSNNNNNNSDPLANSDKNDYVSPRKSMIFKEKDDQHESTSALQDFWKEAGQELLSPSTWIGSFMFVLYHIVFCLASGSAILRPHATNSILGLMTKMAALGVIFSSPVYLYNIGNGLPSMYPTCDLFLAPILAHIAKGIDEDLHHDKSLSLSDEENDEVFLATFSFLAFLGMALAGCLLILAGVFRLANLGAFLPFPVLCGFFAAVGIMTWHLGFVVDTSGKTFHMVFFSGDTSLILYALIHHIPGVIVACLMKYLGPKNPFYVVVVLVATIGAVYAVMMATGTSLEEARDMGWFWHYEDIVYQQMAAPVGFTKWLPPAPFGMWGGLIMGKIYWPAVVNGLQPVCAMSFLYLIRCALHSAALLKNIPNLARSVRVTTPVEEPTVSYTPRKKTRMEVFSEIVDIETVMANVTDTTNAPSTAMELEYAKPISWTLKGVMINYGLAQVVSSLVGGFGVIPSVATSHAMFGLGAEKVGPQLGSVILLLGFYLTDFRLIAFVPKMAFSCLLSLAFIDITSTWFIKSYFKTKEKMEWLVVPLIVVFAFGIGLLQAVFLGIALSTFLFVAAFFRSGVVKFAASGLSVRSTIERPVSSAQWLDENGDQIQIVILQNYLFFGNASSILAYISSMFEHSDEDADDRNLPPLPKYVVLDMALVTGIDTSTVDVISDILNLCSKHDCKLFLSGMSVSLRSVLAFAGVKPLGGERSARKLRFFNSLDTAIGKAEDNLLNFQSQAKAQSVRRLMALGEESGFQLALRKVDEQHGTDFAKKLANIEEYTTPIDLEPNESLYDSASRPERGLFFIEEGVLKIERDSGGAANTRSLRGTSSVRGASSNVTDGGTISGLKARSGSIGREYARLKASNSAPQKRSFRLARVGAGWVVGTVEAVSGMENPGLHIAVTACRLHYLSYSQMEKLEINNPILMLQLYKLLSSMMAKQHEVTIGQLGTLHAIMASPAQLKPIGRKASLAFQQVA